MGAKEDAIQTLVNSAEAFAEAGFGEEVRQGLVNVANALKAVVEGYATVVTDDLTDDDPNAAAQAAAVWNLFNKTPVVNGILPSDSVLADITGTGFWLLSGTNTYVGLPDWIPYSTGAERQKAAGYLMTVSYATSQMLIYYSKNYGVITKYKTGGTWADWVTPTDKTLKLPNMPADSQTVGIELDKRYRPLTGIDTDYPNGYSLIDMPVNTVLVCKGATINAHADNNITDLSANADYHVEKTGRSPFTIVKVTAITSAKIRIAAVNEYYRVCNWKDWVDPTVSLPGVPPDAAVVGRYLYEALNERYRPLTGINSTTYPNGYSLINDMPMNAVAVIVDANVLASATENQLVGLDSNCRYYIEKTGRTPFFKIELRNIDSDAVLTASGQQNQTSEGQTIPGFIKWDMQTIPFELEKGTYRTQDGAYDNSESALNTRARFVAPVNAGNALRLTVSSGVKFTYRILDANLQFVGSGGWVTNNQRIFTTNSNGYYLFVLAYSDDSEITDLSDLKSKANLERVGDDADDVVVDFNTISINSDALSASNVNSPALVFVKYKRQDEKEPVPIGYLYRDVSEPFNFYYDSGNGLNRIFTWDKSVTFDGAQTPIAYSAAITDEGDILFVYRGEMAKMQRLAILRQNPIIYKRGDYEHPVVIDFGANTKPTSWLQNGGVYCEIGKMFIAEYTRPAESGTPSFGKCNVWRVTSPYYNTSNWTIVKQFDIGEDNDHFKHCHTVDRDPYTGILYVSTGDHNDGANMICTSDDGGTWTSLISGNEKYCRQLNFIWTKNWIYWGTDTTDTTMHYLFRAKRASNGQIDISNIEELYNWYTHAATYVVCYSKKHNGLLCLDRYDSRTTIPLNLYFYDLLEQKMKYAGKLNPLGSVFGGFRGEAFQTYEDPYKDGFRCGFSMYPNQNDVLGNERNVNDSDNNGIVYADTGNIGHVNNMVLKLR